MKVRGPWQDQQQPAAEFSSVSHVKRCRCPFRYNIEKTTKTNEAHKGFFFLFFFFLWLHLHLSSCHGLLCNLLAIALYICCIIKQPQTTREQSAFVRSFNTLPKTGQSPTLARADWIRPLLQTKWAPEVGVHFGERKGASKISVTAKLGFKIW